MTGWERIIAMKEIKVHRVADRVRAEAGRDRCGGGGGVPEVGHQRSHFLQLEEEVRWVRHGRAETLAPVGGRERTFEADSSRPDSGQADAPGCVKKKL